MPIDRLNPPTLSDTGGGYHHVVKDGNTVYIAGQVGFDKDHKLPDTPEGQIEQAFKNVQAALTSVGSDMLHITKLTVYMTHREDIPALLTVRPKFIPDEATPAATGVFVSGLFYPELRFEIDVIATIP